MIVFIGTQISPNMMDIPITQLNTNYRKLELEETDEIFKYIKEEDFECKINDFGVRKSLWLYLLSVNKNLRYNKYLIERFQKHSYIYTDTDEVYIFRLTEKLPTYEVKQMRYIDTDIIEIWKLEKLEVE